MMALVAKTLPPTPCHYEVAIAPLEGVLRRLVGSNGKDKCAFGFPPRQVFSPRDSRAPTTPNFKLHWGNGALVENDMSSDGVQMGPLGFDANARPVLSQLRSPIRAARI